VNLIFLTEPDLEFANGGRHIDPRFGILSFGPLDAENRAEPVRIRVGLVGTPQTIEGTRGWLEGCREPVAGKASRLRNLFPDFPGFASDTMFRAELVFDQQTEREIPLREFIDLARRRTKNAIIDAAVDLVMRELRILAEKSRTDVALVALPLEALDLIEPGVTELPDSAEDEPDEDEEADNALEANDFHDLLKARVMALRMPVQLLKPTTYDSTIKRRQKTRADRVRQVQDESTRAWNLFTALYYKGGSYPWRMPRLPTDLATCFLGVSFFRTLDGEAVWTSVAQVFNERGVGVIVRGAPATVSADDRRPHLSDDDTRRLVLATMQRYRQEHGNYPARLVIHKTSAFTQGEVEGARSAICDLSIYSSDILSLGPSNTRLLRHGRYPPLRGTMLTLDAQNHIVYTRGSVPFYGTYPGMYVPRPIAFRTYDADQSPRVLATEILALTKMNWNNTQFDQRDPITIRAAREVGDVLKYLKSADYVESRYSAYM
jgi:hypothetical protein